MGDLSRRSCTMLIMEAVAKLQDRFRDSYVELLNPYSPLDMSYLHEIKPRLENRYRELRRIPAVAERIPFLS